MKKLAFLLILAPLAFNPAIAGSEHGHYKHGDGRHGFMGKMTKDLSLTPEQAGQVQAIMKERHEKMQAIRNKTREKMAAVLNEEQMLKLKEKREAMREKWRERRQERIQKHREMQEGS